MPNVGNNAPTRAAEQPPVTIGRYTAQRSDDPRIDAWYITTPSPLGKQFTPFIVARASSQGLAVQVAAALHTQQVLRAALPQLDELTVTPAGRAVLARLTAAVQAGQP